VSVLLRDLPVLVLDCQAGGATPAHGDLLELGWAWIRPESLGPVRGHWILPRTERRVPGPIRELTGWSEACLSEALPEHDVWAALQRDLGEPIKSPVPTVIHYARFELTFLRDLHARLGGASEFPFDALCLHAMSARLFPDLPRRNIRALAGYLGHSTDLMRRSTGHVQASAFIWRELMPLLGAAGIDTWDALRLWLQSPAPTRRTRRYPIAPERRRALPDRPGVYRFVRRNEDVLYVGKATSLKKRVASHFTSRAGVTERGLELLTQVHDIRYTETASILEAALLESDEIKRIDPPYNVALRSGERQAWFAGRDLREAVPSPDPQHRVGPLPSRRAVSALAALIALADGVVANNSLRAIALAVPSAFLPEPALFEAGWAIFASEHLRSGAGSAGRRVDRAARALWLQRGRKEIESTSSEAEPHVWDLARVRRRLERGLVQSGLLVRRARFLCLLADGVIAFRERDMTAARVLVLSACEIVARHELARVEEIAKVEPLGWRSREQRQASFDAVSYDRLRVIATELRRVLEEGGEVAVRFGRHVFAGEKLTRLMRAV
jgi:DNA polymerase-3 subunit epsilon